MKKSDELGLVAVDRRKERLAAALRSNLAMRKSRARAVKTAEPSTAEDDRYSELPVSEGAGESNGD